MPIRLASVAQRKDVDVYIPRGTPLIVKHLKKSVVAAAFFLARRMRRLTQMKYKKILITCCASGYSVFAKNIDWEGRYENIYRYNFSIGSGCLVWRASSYEIVFRVSMSVFQKYYFCISNIISVVAVKDYETSGSCSRCVSSYDHSNCFASSPKR